MQRILILGVVALISAFIFLWWLTRAGAIPGIYRAEGVWGNSTLYLYPDHTFKQEYVLLNLYNGQQEEAAVNQGTWKELGRHYLDQRFEISQFVGLGDGEQGQRFQPFETSYGPVALTGLGIEVDIADGVVYRK